MYHVSNLGAFGPTDHTDIDGYVPDIDDGPWDMVYDHGAETTHNADDTLTEYGEWWEEEGWPEKQREAIKATAEAEKAVAEWRAGENCATEAKDNA